MADTDDLPAPLPLVGNTASRHSTIRKSAHSFGSTPRPAMGKSFEAIGMHRDNHYHWLRDPSYAEAFKTAQLMAGNKFTERFTAARSFNGIDKPLVYQGQISNERERQPRYVKSIPTF